MLKQTTEKEYIKVRTTLDNGCGCGAPTDTSSVNCKGEKGEKGDKGDKGDPGEGSEATPLFAQNAINIFHDDIENKDYIEWGGPLVRDTLIQVMNKTISFQGTTIIYAQNIPEKEVGATKIIYYDPLSGLISSGDVPTITETPDWHILGNTGTDEAINFFGTIDDKKVNIRTNNVKRFTLVNNYAGIQTHAITEGTPMGGGFYVNAGNATMHYPGANIGIATGNNNNRALSAITEGYWNIAIGDLSLDSLTIGQDNVVMGYQAGKAIINSNDNVIMGNYAGILCIDDYYNTFVGNRSGGGYERNARFIACTGVGRRALAYGGGTDQVAFGNEALYSNIGGGNVGIGNGAGGVYSPGGLNFNNCFIGNQNSNYISTGCHNTCVGGGYYSDSLVTFGGVSNNFANGAACWNTLLGRMAGGEGVTGNGNICIGDYSGNGLNGQRVSGEHNVCIGRRTLGFTNGVSWNIGIGNYISVPAGSGNLNIGNVIYGVGMYSTAVTSGTPTTTGCIGIGVTSPTARLHLVASTTDKASFHLNIGVEPVSPFISNGDIWFDGTKPYMRVGGVSKAFLMEGDVVTGPPAEEDTGTTNAAAFIHEQIAGATTWSIEHNLEELLPSIDVYNDSGVKLLTYTATIVDENNLTITFAGSQTGKAKILSVGGTRFIDNADGGDANTNYGGGFTIDGGTA